MSNHTYSVEAIRKYLLGQLPESETEQLDELSIADDDCAELIRAVESDLYDALARGELRGAELEHFGARHLAAAHGRNAARFAEALQSRDRRAERPASSEQSGAERPHAKAPWIGWLSAAEVSALAIASVWQAFDNRAIRSRLASAELARQQLERENQRLAAEARLAAAPTQASSGAGQTPLAVLVLTSQLRGASRPPTVTLTGSNGGIVVQLNLEPLDYPRYAAVLLTAAGDREVWHVDHLVARASGSRNTLDLHLPATLLSPQDYVIRVSGVPARGGSEIVGEYRFAVVE